MKYYLLKILFKSYEFLLRATTRFRRGFESDFTKILIDNFTQKQQYETNNFYTSKTACALNLDSRLLVVIPFRDQWELTNECLKSLVRQNFEGILARIVLVDNGSTESETSIGIRDWTHRSDLPFEVSILRLDEPFNFSKLNNTAVKKNHDFRADCLLFLNNDTELKCDNMFVKALRFQNTEPNIGAIGCTLLYPNHKIQHLFLAPGIKISGAHPLKNTKFDETNCWYDSPRPVAAVSGALLFVGSKKFDQVDGFDEQLPTSGQDLDFCLKLQKIGCVNWVLPKVVAIHKETKTRRSSFSKQEISYIYKKWGASLSDNAYYSSRFSKWSETPCYRGFERDYPWRHMIAGQLHD